MTENGLPDATDANGLTFYQSLAAGGTGQESDTPDVRIANFANLPAGPFQLTNGTNSATPGFSLTYTDYSASPVHRFYQMWQELNCSLEQASFENPSGCNGNLFSWVETTVGAGTNGLTQTQYGQEFFSKSFSAAFQYPTGFSRRQRADEDPVDRQRLRAARLRSRYHGRRLHCLGVLQRPAGRCALLQEPGGHLRHERQLPPVRQWRHRCQPHHARPRRHDLVQRRERHTRDSPHNVAVTTNPAGFGGPGTIDSIENPNPQPGTNNFYTQDVTARTSTAASR